MRPEFLSPLMRIPPDIVSVADYESLACKHMSASAWAYISGGAADEVTLAENHAAFTRLRLKQRVLADLDGANSRVTILGDTFEYPILLAPVAYQKLAHPEGERATALAASALQAGMVVSTQASTTLEEIAATARAPIWFQLYLQSDREHTRTLVRRAEEAGYRALVVTVDAPVNGIRNREQRTGFTLPSEVAAVNLRGMRPLAAHTAQAGASPLFGGPLLSSAPTWEDVEWLMGLTSLPVLLKGITTDSDAVLAVNCGAAGIIVSNHGGRTLDTLPATIDALPAVVRAVDGRVPVLLDGGIRRGTDVFKALALGATATLIGRPYIYALAVAGAPGVAHVLHILRTELEVAMALTGRPTIGDIDLSAIW
ncbi:alpha-hydroxy-acid oxidizing protein [Candidimonas sp. SYP-B2681]|uniref:alpha-hydroxy acid oxidase n=1 Tax=Candidimonas sp. SYP-B2681 TaxID=2497686 RepID=UPI000F8642BF|nr:alpha-hydroxy acid oxidase [Candidimonas sp. SYP-B2681]RTZ47654.1 alpha-hydroxy-acid oxidizing protein [Candidimonas sp. SYP-B2681]